MEESTVVRAVSHVATSVSDIFKDAGSALFGDSCVLNDIIRYTVWFVLIFILSTFLWRQYYQLARDPSSNLPLPPGCMGFPLVGETLSFIAYGADYYVSRREKYGKVYKTHVLGQATVRVMGAENIRPILMGEHIMVESRWPKSTRLLTGPGGLMNASPDHHRIRKKLLLQALSASVVAGYIPQIQELVKQHLKEWCNQGKVIGRNICNKLSLSLATNILIGFRMEEKEIQNLIADFSVLLNNLLSLPWNIPGSGLSKGLRARGKVIAEIKKRLFLETSQWSLVDELKKLDQTSASLTADEMADALLELWLAGNDTTSSTSCTILLALGRDSRVREKIEEELHQHGLMDPNTDLNLDLLTKLTYVEDVIKEVVRIFPPAGGGFRKAKKTFEIGGYQIPEGWTVIYSIRDTHQTTELFEQREEFLPERWPEMVEKTREIGQKFHYIPFGAGARSCPGDKFAKIFLKIFIIELIRTCSWELKNKTPKIRYFPITHPADGLPVTFTLRKDLDRPQQQKG